MRSRNFTALTLGLILISLTMISFIAFKFWQTSGNDPIVSTKVAILSNVKEYDAPAFVKINAAESTNHGSIWEVNIETNDWSTCRVELYDADEQLSSTAETSSTNWTWNVPSDAKRGSWVARFFCGAFDNMAIVDHKLEVR